MTATDISDNFPVSAPAISQHLKVLRETNLVRMEKRAQKRIYSVNPEGIDELGNWAQRMRRMWTERFDALEELLSAEKGKQETKDE